METYLIMLLATNAVGANLVAVNTAQATALNCAVPIEWREQPQEEKGGIVYYRVVATTAHLQNNLRVSSATLDTSKTAWTSLSSKGLIALRGNDWRKTLDLAGYSPVTNKISEVTTK